MVGTTDTLRRFNRTWSQRVGVLEESFIGTGRPLGVSRVLFEIGPGGTTARDLRERLDLDSGYCTRLLRRLGDEGLVEVRPDPADRRRRQVTLTAEGLAVWRDLDDRSESLASALVDPLTERQRTRRVDALAAADLLIRAATVHLREVPPDDPAAVGAVGRYFEELDDRFPGGFDPGDAGYAGAPAGRGAFVVATSDGQPVACGGVVPLDASYGDRVAEIKRMWVDPDWRGAGLGSRLLRHLEQRARDLGHRRVLLDTNATLVEAVAMYERAGYAHVERYNDNPYAQAWFAKDLT
jgi:DNA-binding MarR family transcriptional regulator